MTVAAAIASRIPPQSPSSWAMLTSLLPSLQFVSRRPSLLRIFLLIALCSVCICPQPVASFERPSQQQKQSSSLPPSRQEEKKTCRLSPGGGVRLAASEFRSQSCAYCLLFLYFAFPPYSVYYASQVCPDGLLVCARSEQDTNCSCADKRRVYNLVDFVHNTSRVSALSSLRTEPALPFDFAELTRECCQAADTCCRNVLAEDDVKQKEEYIEDHNATGNDKRPSCPATWDGWTCFGRVSSPGQTIRAVCPSYILGDRAGQSTAGRAEKRCEPDGQWLRTSDGREWTDYAGCLAEQSSAQTKLKAGIAAFTVSLALLLPALIVTTFLRPIRSQPTFILHRHLMLSFLLYALSFLLSAFVFIVDGAPGSLLTITNHVSCRLMFVFQLRYIRLSTFSWMLAEAVHLFRVLTSNEASATIHDDHWLRPYCLACWGIPALVSLLYGLLRETFDNEACWISPSTHPYIEWVIIVPCLVALCCNLLLLSVIMYIVVNKLRFNPHLEPMQYRKAVRALCMLFPVFGLHFLFTIYRIPSTLHETINLVLDGLQGSAVSFILVYTNRSVLEAVRTWWCRSECDNNTAWTRRALLLLRRGSANKRRRSGQTNAHRASRHDNDTAAGAARATAIGADAENRQTSALLDCRATMMALEKETVVPELEAIADNERTHANRRHPTSEAVDRMRQRLQFDDHSLASQQIDGSETARASPVANIRHIDTDRSDCASPLTNSCPL